MCQQQEFLLRNMENVLEFIIKYHNDPQFLDRQVWENSADPDLLEEQSD